MKVDRAEEKMRKIMDFLHYLTNPDVRSSFNPQTMFCEYSENPDSKFLQDHPGEIREKFFSFLTSLFFIYEKLFDFALNDSLCNKTAQPLICLKLFSDLNLLVHLVQVIFNARRGSCFYFTFGMDRAVSDLINYFYQNFNDEMNIAQSNNEAKSVSSGKETNEENTDKPTEGFSNKIGPLGLSLSEKVAFLIDETKKFNSLLSKGVLDLEIEHPATLEFWDEIPKQRFLENLANAIVLSGTDPMYWELPSISGRWLRLPCTRFVVS